MADEKQALPEAPGSATVKIVVDGFEWLYTTRSLDPAELLTQLGDVTNAMKALGYTPAKGYQAKSGGGGGGRPGYTPPDPNAPECPIHHKPMWASTKPGIAWYCRAKIAEDGGDGKPMYCRHIVKANENIPT